MPSPPESPSPASAAPLKPRALYQEVADRLRQQIVARELEPGSWIDELKLAAAYGTSRTPLREALKVLAAEGLVTMKVRRGAYVTEMSADDVAQVYRLLSLIESDAARTVAMHATAAQRAELAGLHARLESLTRRRAEFLDANERFHLALLEIAGNRWALQTVRDLRKVMRLSRQRSLTLEGRLSESLQEHHDLMRAIESRDGAAAARLMQAHFDSGREAAAAA